MQLNTYPTRRNYPVRLGGLADFNLDSIFTAVTDTIGKVAPIAASYYTAQSQADVAKYHANAQAQIAQAQIAAYQAANQATQNSSFSLPNIGGQSNMPGIPSGQLQQQTNYMPIILIGLVGLGAVFLLSRN